MDMIGAMYWQQIQEFHLAFQEPKPQLSAHNRWLPQLDAHQVPQIMVVLSEQLLLEYLIAHQLQLQQPLLLLLQTWLSTVIARSKLISVLGTQLQQQL